MVAACYSESSRFLRQRKKCRACSLGVRGLLTSPPVCQSLALDALGGNGGTLEVADVARIVSEIELSEISLEVLGRNPLVVAGDATLEDREVVLNRV